MSYLLKDLFAPNFYENLSNVFVKTLNGFDRDKFIKMIYVEDFESKALKERMKHTTLVLHHFMPQNFTQCVLILDKIINQLRIERIGEDSLPYMFLPDYIETYGLDDFESAVKALEFTTQFISCEFAVRPFVLKYRDAMLEVMLNWSTHENHKVRRLASEGSRPRLPWAMGIPALKKDPSDILPILENLKADTSEYVRRSVANNLNDIAKDHPSVVLEIAKRWSGLSKDTDAIVKHGSRTLLKQGHSEILKHYGLSDKGINLSNFKILTPVVNIGSHLEFSFSIANENTAPQKVRLEYGIYYMKQNGQLSKKVFKISERDYLPGGSLVINRRQKFVLITTRKFYPGKHRISIIINGIEKEISDFELV
ncbi:DNA alkylation repair protein [Pedobacter aquatilis]|uniref:DNA alkylation repair protein n=1 Tax=Pedobacter aquatilis TaxID=351343 RepID=UPI0025B5485F|nr:DNA alkylation repair protein [Pedobacter aquatilis]MDN3585921.1 DNA alkylation repair protein [Pedobacter aquatilis]